MDNLGVEQNRSFSRYLITEDNLLDYALDWMRDNLEPEDVFCCCHLEEWALENGFVEEESNG